MKRGDNMGGLNPDYWGKNLKKPCTLTLKIRCVSSNEADRIRALIIELVMKEYGIKPKSYKFGVEK